MNNPVARIFGTILAAGILACSAHAWAEEAAEHAALRELVGKYERAIAASNPDELEPYLSKDFSGAMVTGEEVDSMKSLKEYWDYIQSLIGKGGMYRVKVNIPSAATIDGDLAYAHGTTDETVTTGAGKTYKFNGRWTAICRKEGDGWKIVRIHGSMDPVRNEFVTAAVTAAARTTGAIAAGVGLLLGAVLTWGWRRVRSPRAAT